MQNNEIPVLDFTDLKEEEIDYFIYTISEFCENLARYEHVTIRVIKRQELSNE